MSMFNTVAAFSEVLIENDFERLTHSEQVQLQWQRGNYFFKERLNYRAAVKVFTRCSLPTEQLILLFADVLPKKYID